MGSIHGNSVPRAKAEHHVYSATGNLESTHMVIPNCQPTPEFDLPTTSRFGKFWGHSIPFHLIHVKTKRDWTQVKGLVDYVDMGNGWILFKFANVHDWDFVWGNRP